MKKNKERGFTTVDLSIAMIVVAMFVTIMGSVFYNVYLSSTEAKRTATALNYGVDIFERIGDKSLNFGTITPEVVLENLSEELGITEITQSETGSQKVATGKIGTKGAYDIKLTMKDAVKSGETTIIKQFKLTIKYDVAAKKEPETIELERIRPIHTKTKQSEEGV